MENSCITIEETENGKKVVCSDSMDISNVSETQTLLRQLLSESPAEIQLVTKSLESIDTSAMQLIVAFIRSAKQRDIKLHIDAPSDSVNDVSKALGLNKILLTDL